VGLDTATVLPRLGRWHAVQLDASGRIVAFQGLSLAPTPHRLRVDGMPLYAWCAWDMLFLPELMGRPAVIESTCPATGRAVSLRVEPSGPTGVSPPHAALSLLLPRRPYDDEAISSFCRYIHFFASRVAAEAWTACHPGTFVTSIQHGFDIGRRTNAAQLGDALRHPPT
jgi:alkylmercury lyase